MNSLYIFSLDGVLVDCRRDIFAAVNQMRADYQAGDLPVDQFKLLLGKGTLDFVAGCVSDLDVDQSEAVDVYQRYYSENLFETTKLYVGVRDGISKLHSVSHRLAVLSNKPTHITKEILDHFALTRYFYIIVGEGGDHPVRPNPEALQMMMHEAESDVRSTWFISDNTSDMIMAEQAGIKRVYAKYGYGRVDSAHFDLKLMSFIDFEKFIDCGERF